MSFGTSMLFSPAVIVRFGRLLKDQLLGRDVV